MKIFSLIDRLNHFTFTVDVSQLIFRVETREGVKEEYRIKPFMAMVLYHLFQSHPEPLTYEQIEKILKKYHFMVNDDLTRMHRKISEIRKTIASFTPYQEQFILNQRNYGYHLPLALQNIELIECNENLEKLSNPHIQQALQMIQTLIDHAVELVKKSEIIQHPEGLICHRKTHQNELIVLLEHFHMQQKIILQEIPVHFADFYSIRIRYLLSKIETYLGLARVSEFPITPEQFQKWFHHELREIFENLIRMIRYTEYP